MINKCMLSNIMTTISQVETDLSALSAFHPFHYHHLLNTFNSTCDVRAYIIEVLDKVNDVTKNYVTFTIYCGGNKIQKHVLGKVKVAQLCPTL